LPTLVKNRAATEKFVCSFGQGSVEMEMHLTTSENVKGANKDNRRRGWVQGGIPVTYVKLAAVALHPNEEFYLCGGHFPHLFFSLAIFLCVSVGVMSRHII